MPPRVFGLRPSLPKTLIVSGSVFGEHVTQNDLLTNWDTTQVHFTMGAFRESSIVTYNIRTSVLALGVN
jgi:hypothetical protein